MHRIATTALVVALGMFVAGCDDDDNPTSPSNTIRFTANLLPSNENPAITGPEASGTGSATTTFNLTRDSSQNITAATADFNVTLTGFPANTPVNLAHIHTGASGVNGGVLVDLGINGLGIVLANGTGTFTRSGINVTPTDAQNIINNPAGFYFNVHSTQNPGGFARGQLVRQ
jgi:CHRD domain-containing protein